jgi:cytochrome P450
MAQVSTSAARQPVYLTGWAAGRRILEFLRDPLMAMRDIYEAHGELVYLQSPVPFIKSRNAKIVATGARFNREVLSDPVTWRTTGIVLRGPKGSAQSRLRMGIMRMNGRQHQHYRRLFIDPLRPDKVDAMGPDMARLTQAEVESWPLGQTVDLWPRLSRLTQLLSSSLLFGKNDAYGMEIAELLHQHGRFNYSPAVVACPLDAPGTPYHRMLRHSEMTERRILEWAETKRGTFDPADLLSVIINSPDENGNPPNRESIAGHIPTLFGGSFETCQTVLAWTLTLLAQHPRIAADLYAELRQHLTGMTLSLDAVSRLPLLDAVVKESMRVLPPVPLQWRVAMRDTTIQGHSVRAGSRVMLSALMTNRAPDLYPEPERFRPERWSTISPSVYEYCAFGAGPRACLGYSFGVSMVKLGLAAILMRYRIALPPGTRIDYKIAVTMMPKAGLRAEIHRQDGKFSANPITGKIRNLVTLPTEGTA